MTQMIPINRTFGPLVALVDELARCGMRHAVTSPGSRNAPLSLTLAAHEGISAVSVIDERAAGFMALGMAKASGLPVAVTCTSGTAAANLLPAVVEAHEARVPLIVLSADRPPELREIGAGQAIDQIGLYGSAAKWFCEVGNGEPGREWAVHMRALGCRAWATARGGRPGPVHLNLPLREPLAPIADSTLDPADYAGRPSGAPWTDVRVAEQTPAASTVSALAAFAAHAERGAIVCGPVAGDVAGPVSELAHLLGWPVLAEPTSGLRCGPHDRSHVVAGYDLLLRSERFVAAHAPDLVLRIGDTPTSKPLRAWLAAAAQVVVDPHATFHEPTRAADLVVQADPGLLCATLGVRLRTAGEARDEAGWVERWRRADAAAAGGLAAGGEPFEPAVYAALLPVLADGAQVWVSSSMPVRDVESWFPSSERAIRFLSNRGANGIDGVVASAAGAALATGTPTTVLIGDVALTHDIGGLLAAARAGVPLTVVCVDNGGGAIFDALPVAAHAERAAYEQHVATAGTLDMRALAQLAGMDYRLAADHAAVTEAAEAGGFALVHVPTDRATATAARRTAVAAAVAAVDATL